MSCKLTKHSMGPVQISWLHSLQTLWKSKHTPGFLTLIAVLLVLSAGVGMQPLHRTKIFLAGEIATIDVVAERNLLIEDVKATAARREQIANRQPSVFDLSASEAVRFRQRFLEIFQLVNGDSPALPHKGHSAVTPGAGPASSVSSGQETSLLIPVSASTMYDGESVDSGFYAEIDMSFPVAGDSTVRTRMIAQTDEDFENDGTRDDARILQRLQEMSGVSFDQEAVQLLKKSTVQMYMIDHGLPWVEARLSEGVVSDTRGLLSSPEGVRIRNLDTGEDLLRPDAKGIRDIPSMLTLFSQFLRANSPLNLPERRLINQLTTALVMPTLTINREATRNLGLVVSENAAPVYYRVNKGEIIVQRGERVTQTQQFKMQSMFRSGKTLLRAPQTVGIMVITLVLSVGLFLAPSGKASSPLRRRDLYFIAFLLLLFGVAAKGLYVLGPRFAEVSAIGLLPFVFPVAGAAGLAALIFASRRYCVTGILLSLFSTMLLGGGLLLFLFYFLSAMFNTWLVMRAQNRQDVVRSMLPLALFLIPLGFASALFEGIASSEAPSLLLCLVVNVVLTQFIMFSVSPILELVFGYTTRFRLMELLNLEQPLLQDLMVSAPGTYHHSLVVSNMVEAGAKAIGANSLLCKVGALYHDIGKLAYPEYFIENQFGAPNRHDKLASTMSALILVSHVKKGIDLAVKHRLGEDVEDLIGQHHGSSTMRFFYQRAVEQAQDGEVVRVEDFQYPGPRPQTREAAIVMVADMVEASSRTLADPTPARIRTHVDTIIRGIFSDGQLDESALTFQDLNKLSVSFSRILTGLFHQRIAYPDMNKKKEEQPAVAAAETGMMPHKVPSEQALDSA